MNQKNSALILILKKLKKFRKNIEVPIPSYWDYENLNFTGEYRNKNLYDILIKLIEDILSNKLNDKSEDRIIYSALVRTTTAFDFDNDNKLSLENKYGLRETGTFLRMILLIPLLKKMGVTILYLLPVALNSEKFKKGDAPSIYSIKNFFKLDKYLFDPMIGKYNENLLDIQFKAFIEAYHLSGIKVILDLIPRTAARDNDLIREHPDWFYWVKKEYEDSIKPPFIKELPNTPYFPEYTKFIYNSPETKEHLKKFTFSPDKINKKLWEKTKKNKEDILKNIEKNFNITTAPGFSDVINDSQPLWKEITFLRLYLDHPIYAKKYLEKNQPPYILFDVIKSSRAPGKKPNKKLWKLISGILPFWQKKYGIDGVRIDMAHALPSELEKMIIEKAKKIDKNFILIAEELDINNSAKAKKAGYHSIIGDLWADEPRWKNGNIKKVFKNLKKLKIPILATSETHDTPRTIMRDGKIKLSYFTCALNFIFPNSIPFINSGFEIKEIQPMNKGLDSEFSNIYALPKKDLNYGKLALFDFTSLHWNTKSDDIINLMNFFKNFRDEFPVLKEFNKFNEVDIIPDENYIFSYYYKIKHPLYNYILFIINSNLTKSQKIKINLKFNFRTIENLFELSTYIKKKKFQNNKLKMKIKGRNIIYKIKSGEIVISGIK